MKRLIYAEDAMSRIKAETRFYSGTYAEIERAIDTAPTIESNRLSVEWIYLGYGEWQCPVCKSIYGYGKDFKYCPERTTSLTSRRLNRQLMICAT